MCNKNYATYQNITNFNLTFNNVIACVISYRSTKIDVTKDSDSVDWREVFPQGLTNNNFVVYNTSNSYIDYYGVYLAIGN